LFAEKGIVVSLNDEYANRYFISSLIYLREELKCSLPIEVWHDGEELSEETMMVLKEFSNITFCDFEKFLNKKFGSLRGWHSKPFMLHCSRFDEICLMDADVYFFDNPEKMFLNKGYLETGAYFFRDRIIYYPPDLPFFVKRKKMFRALITKPSSYVPEQFLHLWDDQISVGKSVVIGDYQEAGCLFIDKKRHLRGISKIIHLTLKREYVYDCVHGDKETYWMGLEIAKEPYTFNDSIPCAVKSNGEENTMIHFVEGALFYEQKQPIQALEDTAFSGYKEILGEDELYLSRKATLEEIDSLNKLYRCYKECN
jgi:hypothetical protein